MKRKEIIQQAANETLIAEARLDLPFDIQRYEFAASKALELAGFSDENVPDSPRPVSNSPRNAGKNGEFGPTELR